MTTMRSVLTVFFLFTAVFLHAQDLTGVWQGHFRSENEIRSALSDDRYKFEVQIAQHNKTFSAITYSYLSSVFYGKALATGTVNPKTAKVLLQEGKLVEIRMGNAGGACTMTCFLQYSKSGDEEFLEGTFGSMNIEDSSNCGRGTIFLRKVTNSDFYKEPFVEKREKEIIAERTAVARNRKKTIPPPVVTAKKTVPTPATAAHARQDSLKRIVTTKTATPKNPAARIIRPDSTGKKLIAAVKTRSANAHPRFPPPARVGIASLPQSKTKIDSQFTAPPTVTAPERIPEVLANRSNELVRTITVNTNEVTLNIYDDGAIDHDTVTVFLDKKMVVAHAMLTDRAIVVTLHLDDSHPYHEVVMVADNEGEIPPNTSLMIVKAGDKEYEVRITSTEQKNAVVIFKYEKGK
jgi:hypothetical protein